jgi:hypothetical protein
VTRSAQAIGGTMLLWFMFACGGDAPKTDTGGPAETPSTTTGSTPSGSTSTGTTPTGVTSTGTTPTGTTSTGTTSTGTTPTGTTPTGTAGCGVVPDPTVAPAPSAAVHLAWVFDLTATAPGDLTLTLDGAPLATRPAASSHAVPVLGLRPDTAHTVGWTLRCGDDVRSGSLPLVTPPLGLPWPDATVLTAGDVGLTLIDLQSPGLADYIAVLHADGAPAWVLETNKVVDVRRDGDTLVAVERFDVVRWDWLGAELSRHSPDPGPGDIEVDTYGFHHEVFPVDDGFVALSTSSQVIADYPAGYLGDATARATVEDPLVVEVADDGTVRARWSLLDLLDSTRVGWGSLDDAELGLDWGHANAVVVHPSGDLVVSVRHQGAVVRFQRDGTLVWILGDPGGWQAPWSDVLLAPVGAPFAWPHHQHAPMLHPSGDGRLLVFDNGNYGRVNPYGDLDDGLGNYSRLVEYRVGDGTVEQTWEYVDTSTGALFASTFGDADYVDSGTVLGVWGSLLSEGGVANEAAGLGRKSTRLIEVDPATDAVVWDLRLGSAAADAPEGWQVHRAERLDGFVD